MINRKISNYKFKRFCVVFLGFISIKLPIVNLTFLMVFFYLSVIPNWHPSRHWPMIFKSFLSWVADWRTKSHLMFHLKKLMNRTKMINQKEHCSCLTLIVLLVWLLHQRHLRIKKTIKRHQVYFPSFLFSINQTISNMRNCWIYGAETFVLCNIMMI